MLVGGRERLAVFQHAHQWQYLLAEALVLFYDAAEVFSEVAQFRLGGMYALVARLDYPNDFGKVVLRRRGFLCRCVGSCRCSVRRARRGERGGWREKATKTHTAERSHPGPWAHSAVS